MSKSDYSAPASYWVIIEASLAIISACLPTIRPVFHSMSPKSIIRSIRSVFSLNSLRSNGGKHDVFKDLERSNRNDSKSSTVGFNDMPIPMDDSGLVKKVTRPATMEDRFAVPEDGMMIQKSFTVTADRVWVKGLVSMLDVLMSTKSRLTWVLALYVGRCRDSCKFTIMRWFDFYFLGQHSTARTIECRWCCLAGQNSDWCSCYQISNLHL